MIPGGWLRQKARRRSHHGPQLVVSAGVGLGLVEIQNTYSLPTRALPHQTRRVPGLCWMEGGTRTAKGWHSPSEVAKREEKARIDKMIKRTRKWWQGRIKEPESGWRCLTTSKTLRRTARDVHDRVSTISRGRSRQSIGTTMHVALTVSVGRIGSWLTNPSCRLTKYLACFRAGCVSLDLGRVVLSSCCQTRVRKRFCN